MKKINSVMLLSIALCVNGKIFAPSKETADRINAEKARNAAALTTDAQDTYSHEEPVYGKHKRGQGGPSSIPPVEKPEPIEVPTAKPPVVQLPAITDPTWSSLMGKPREGSPITIKNDSKHRLWVAVYERYTGEKPQRYGNVYMIEPGKSLATIVRPHWNIIDKAKGDRLVFFSENKNDIDRDDRMVDDTTVGSILISEGSNPFKSIKSFSIFKE